ncbi:N-acyl-D-amino-acid deacylase family protein [Candidatus Palauibacter irciniicola]|uniref:N-acyl-D-amino-acid deacylase family protein n=1 Tax=Candidatus Palauibacter irciniicola TaxID=3056733 RepID=UPI003B01800F
MRGAPAARVPGRPTLPGPAPALAAALVLAACGVGPESADDGATTRTGGAPYDLVIVGGTVVDGTGADRFTADVGIRDGRVVEVARDGGLSGQGAEEINASGLIVSPGFVDHHNHVQNQVHRRPLAENFIRQGITTILPSLHSGDQPYPLRDYIDDLEVAPNIGFFAGHTWTREQVLGMEDRAPTPEELDEMRDLVREAMEDGALGLATGLLYVPANYAETEEVIELAKVAAEYGGIYYTHMRDEARGLLPAVREAIRIGAEGGLPVHINHFKAMGVDSWGKTVQSLALVDSARAAGIDVKVDVYPYTAGSTGSGVLFPQWVLAGGIDSFRVRVTDPETRARMEPEIREWMRRDWTGGDLSRIQFRTLRAFPEYNGRRMSDLAADRGLPNNDATGVQLAIELQLAGGFSAIYHFMDEADVIRIMRHPQAMFETDGDPVGYGLGFPHPRSYGTFPRILGRYVREMGVLTLEEAIRKMTSMSTDEIGQSERGRIAPGMWADITVFDADRIIDQADYVDPHRYSVGIHHVIVNGVPVILDGSVTGAKPGQVLKGPARHLTETRG